MQGIESFIDALSLYVTNNVLVVVFLIAAIYILKKSSQRQRKYFVAVAVISILLVFNGITFAIVKRMGEDTTYYRFFWICPIVLVSAYLVVELLFEAAVKKIQKICLLAVFGVMLFVNYGQSFSGWTNLPSNIYQIDDDIVQLGDLVDEKSGGKRTFLLVNEYVSAHIREYNANIIINPDGMLYLNPIVNGNNINYASRYVMTFLASNWSEYIAVEKEKIGTNRLFQSIGCEKIGVTDTFNLYYYNYPIHWEEEALWEKAEEMSLYISSEYINVPGLKDEKDYLYVTDLWINTPKEQKQAIINLANELQVEALIINGSSENTNFTEEFLEKELEGLKVPYIYNNKGPQCLEEEEFAIVCMRIEEYSDKEYEEFKGYLSLEKPVILVTGEQEYAKDEKNVYMELVLSESSPVIEIVVNNAKLNKEMLNENVMLYSASRISMDVESGFVTLLRVKGLESE